MIQTLLAGITILLTACAATSSLASCDGEDPSPCAAGMADVAILDRATGEQLTIYTHQGERWVVGTPGHRYAVSIRSRWPGRILGVVSVDGVNAVTGETASWGQRGYVLPAWSSFDVLGWRKSQERVADFVFTRLEDSYAARTGRPDDVGVIGIAVFREADDGAATSLAERSESKRETDREAGRPAPYAPAPYARTPSAPADSSALGSARAEAAPQERQRLGTGHGQSEVSHVASTRFERAREQPDQVIVIRYDRRDRLVAMGVIPGDEHAPHAFPRSASADFVPDPPARW